MPFISLDFPKRLYRIYRPYFGQKGKPLKGKALHRRLALFGIIVGKLCYALLASVFNSAVNAMIGTLENPAVTYSSFYSALGPVAGFLFLHLVVDKINSLLINFLRGSLTESFEKHLTKQWFKNNAFYGIDNHAVSPPQVLTTHCPEFIASSFRLVDDFLRVTFQCCAGIVGLYLLSWSMLIGSLLYAIAYNFITHYISQSLHAKEAALKTEEAKLHAKSQHIVTHAESIAFLRAGAHEHAGLRALLFARRKISEAANSIRLLLCSNFFVCL